MMKLAAFTLLATTAHGAGHLAECVKGCARSSCDDATAQTGLLAVDKKLAVATTDGTGAKKKHAAQGSAEHVPFVCKAKSSGKRRNLAGHVQLTLRVAVAGVNGSTSVLDNMVRSPVVFLFFYFIHILLLLPHSYMSYPTPAFTEKG